MRAKCVLYPQNEAVMVCLARWDWSLTALGLFDVSNGLIPAVNYQCSYGCHENGECQRNLLFEFRRYWEQWRLTSSLYFS